MYIDNNPRYESEKSTYTTVCPNSHSEQYELEEDYAIPAIDTIPMETNSSDKYFSGSEMHGNSIQLNQNVAYSPNRVQSKTQDLSAAADEESYCSPLPQYEVIKNLQNHYDDTIGSPSPEYAEIISKDKQRAEDMEEQHYYHSTDVHYYSNIAEVNEPNLSSQ